MTGLDFEGLSDLESVTIQFPGLTFSNTITLTAGISVNEFDFPPRSGVNVASDDSGAIEILFSTPILSFSGYFTYLVPLSLQAFGLNDAMVASTPSLFSANDGYSGEPGSSPNEFLQVAYAGGISRVVIIGDSFGGSFTMDDVEYSAVPEPSTGLLLVSALSALTCLSRRRSKLINNYTFMRKTLLVFGAAVLLLGGGLWWLRAAPVTPPPVSAPTATPNIVTVATPTPVLFTVSIPEPTLNPASVNLLRVNLDGSSTVIAQMLDNGQNGDEKSGDKVFTARLTLNEVQPGTLGFQVSAAFRGVIRRSLSDVLQFAALAPTSVPVVLPPDPGEAGKATLEGIDSDGNGVRDDVQRYIIFTYPNSEKTRIALMVMAKASQLTVLQSSDKDAAIKNTEDFTRAQQCLEHFIFYRTARTLKNDLRAELLNTETRTKAWLDAQQLTAGEVRTVAIQPHELKAKCTFDLDSMEN
ncbi:MAG: PEP-CTERM sorting domain-containing protein [Bacteroidetes bacterium]|nr:PEP-CTERM sorting domain-containing protein [Bacteroidota bacterium]